MKVYGKILLFIFILTHWVYAYEPVNTELLLKKNRTPLIRLGVAANEMICMDNSKTHEEYNGCYGIFADFNIYSKRKYFHRGMDIYVRTGYRKFRSKPYSSGNISLKSSMDILSAGPGIRLVYGCCCFKKWLFQIFISAHPELIFAWEKPDENDETTKYLSTGIVDNYVNNETTEEETTELLPGIPGESLLVCYTFSGDFLDQTGNGHEGLGINTAFTSDRFGEPGKACLFNGTDTYIGIPASNGFNLSEMSFSISIWVYQTEMSNERVLTISDGGGGAYVDIYLDGGKKPSLVIEDVLSTGTGLVGSEISAGIWNHIVFIVDENNVTLYINDVFDGSFTYVNDFITYAGDQNAVIGNSLNLIPTKYFNGIIDEILIYSRAITPEEVTKLYNETN